MPRRTHARWGKQLSFGSRNSQAPVEPQKVETARAQEKEPQQTEQQSDDDWLLSDSEEATQEKEFFSDTDTEYNIYPKDEWMNHLPWYGPIEIDFSKFKKEKVSVTEHEELKVTAKEKEKEVEKSSTEMENKVSESKSSKKKRKKRRKMKDKAKVQATTPEIVESKETTSPEIQMDTGEKETSFEKVEQKKEASEVFMETTAPKSIVAEEVLEKKKELTPPIAKNKDNPETLSRSRNTVIRGLPIDTCPDKIKFDLEKNGYNPRKIVRMTSKAGQPIPLFLVSFQGEEQTGKLGKILEKDIKVEPYCRRRGPPQCFCCQKFGHRQESCKLPPKCMKCGDDHRTYDCTKDRSLPPKCANCGLGHTANYQGCKEFKKNQERITTKKTEKDISPDLQEAITSLGKSDILKIVNFIAKLLSERMKRKL